MNYKFNFMKQLFGGLVSFITVIFITPIFNSEINWTLAIAIGISTFITSGFYNNDRC